MNVQVRDRGVYVCVAHNDGGLAQASSIVEVERKYKKKCILFLILQLSDGNFRA